MTVYINWHILSGFTANYQNYFSNKVILWFTWKPKAALGIHHILVQKIYIFWALNWKCGSEMLGPNKEGTDLSFMDKRLLNPALKRTRLEKQSSVKWRAHHKRFELYCCGIMRKNNFNNWFFTSYFNNKKQNKLAFSLFFLWIYKFDWVLSCSCLIEVFQWHAGDCRCILGLQLLPNI